MGERSTGLNPGENSKKATKGDVYSALSDMTTGYNLRDDMVGEMTMKYLRSKAEEINKANKKAKKSRGK